MPAKCSDMEQDPPSRPSPRSWKTRTIPVLGTLLIVAFARNVEDVMEHFGLHRVFTEALTDYNWLWPVRSAVYALGPLGRFLASDIFLGMVIAAGIFAFIDYRHLAARWLYRRRNPTDPIKKLKKYLSSYETYMLPAELIPSRCSEIRACSDAFSGEENVLYALETIALCLEERPGRGRDRRMYRRDMNLFIWDFLRVITKYKKPERDKKMAEMLSEQYSYLPSDTFKQRIINSPAILDLGD